MNNSRFYRLNNYCLIEYLSYDDNSQTDLINPEFKVLHNKYDGNVQSFNLNQYNNVTHNIQDYTVVHTSNNMYVNVDQDRVPDYIDYDDKLISYVPTQQHYNYDIIRIHFLSGFKFTEFAANILNVTYPMNNGKFAILANVILNQSNYIDLVTLNPRPIYMNDGFFDKYVDIIIPSINKINIEYYTSNTPELTLGAKLTPRLNAAGDGFDGHIGFLQNQPLMINLYQSDTYNELELDGVKYDSYIINNVYNLSIMDSNKFDGVSVYINESDAGNFIEYGMLHFGNFPEGFISDLNKLDPNSNWVIIHEISVYEHIGAIEKKTGEYIHVQRDSYDEHMKFRPVLKYASDDVAFSIDYLMRFVDQNSGEQIMRHGSLTLTNPKSYGYDTRSISSNFTLNPYKIYNKLVVKSGIDKVDGFINDRNKEPRVIYVDKVKEVIKNRTVPYIVSIINVGLMNKSTYNKNTNLQNLIHGQGKLVLNITPFDNYYKFVVFDKTMDNKFTPMDLNVVDKLKVVFMAGDKEYHIHSDNKPTNSKEIVSSDGLDTKLYSHGKEETKSKVDRMFIDKRPIKFDDSKLVKSIVPKFNTNSTENVEIVNAGSGEILFKLSKETASILYKQGSGEFFINVIRDDGSEMTLYYGVWKAVNQNETKTNKSNLDYVPDVKETTVKVKESDKLFSTDPVSKKMEIPDYKNEFDPNGNISIVNKMKPLN